MKLASSFEESQAKFRNFWFAKTESETGSAASFARKFKRRLASKSKACSSS